MNDQSASLITPHRAWLRIEDFLLLDGSGAFDDFSKTELIDGEIICLNSQFQRHSYIKSQLAFRLAAALAATRPELLVLVEVAVAMPPHDMPEPDIVVMRGPLGQGAVALADVALVIEVADTTRDTDLGRKAALYARGGISEYWVADLPTGEIVRHWQPASDGYARREATALGADLSAATLPGLAIATTELA